MRLDYKAPYDLGMRSPADQEEVIYNMRLHHRRSSLCNNSTR